jgi:hypothetical protein
MPKSEVAPISTEELVRASMSMAAEEEWGDNLPKSLEEVPPAIKKFSLGAYSRGTDVSESGNSRCQKKLCGSGEII